MDKAGSTLEAYEASGRPLWVNKLKQSIKRCVTRSGEKEDYLAIEGLSRFRHAQHPESGCQQLDQFGLAVGAGFCQYLLELGFDGILANILRLGIIARRLTAQQRNREFGFGQGQTVALH